MFRNTLLRPGAARAIILLQLLPLIALRPRGYAVTSQEWWLPAILAVLALISAVRVLSRGGGAPWPWYLFSFSQGFSIISKLMMLMPHASTTVNGVRQLDVAHVGISVVSMALSAFVIWYCEQPEVRNLLAAAGPERARKD
jgi:hypothetical protein